MANDLTAEYLKQHQKPDSAHFTEVGVLISNAIMTDAVADIEANGPQPSVELDYKVTVTVNASDKCVQVTWTRPDGSTLTYHRPR